MEAETTIKIKIDENTKIELTREQAAELYRILSEQLNINGVKPWPWPVDKQQGPFGPIGPITCQPASAGDIIWPMWQVFPEHLPRYQDPAGTGYAVAPGSITLTTLGSESQWFSLSDSTGSAAIKNESSEHVDTSKYVMYMFKKGTP